MAGWDLGLDYGHAVRRACCKALAWRFCSYQSTWGVRVRAERKKQHGHGNHQPARNIGASVGIATVTTMLDRRAQFHQSRLMERVNDFSAAYHNTLNGMQVKLVAAGSTAAHASAQAHGMIYGTIQRQSVMLALLTISRCLA